jgi:hypothetical protein
VGTTNSQAPFVNGSTQAVYRGIFSKDNSSTAFDSAIGQLAIDNINTTTNNYSQLAFTTSDGANRVVTAGIYAQITARSSANWTTSNLQFYTGAVGGPPTEKMRINSAGYVGIGTTSPDVTFTVFGGSVGNTTGKAAFYTGGDENSISAARNEAIRIGRGDTGGAYYSSIWSASGSSATETLHWLKFYISNGNGTSQTLACSMFGNGDVSVAGALSKGSGSFRIEHPLPTMTETHELVHSFIEGPQADLIYRGKVNLVEGKAVVNIDTASDMTEGTFVILCRDVQCFTTNESDWTAVRGSVHGNLLTIEAQDQTCTASISWMVIGERQDKHMYDTEWTDDNGKVIVEPLKTDLAPKTVQI